DYQIEAIEVNGGPAALINPYPFYDVWENQTIAVTFVISDLPPPAPQNLAATPSNHQITLTWDRNTEPDLHKYNIYRDTASPAETLIDNVVASSPPDTFYVDTNVIVGTPYYYRVTAVDSAGNESGYSNEASATLEAATIVINEILQNPAAVYDNLGEWFELYNPGAAEIDINGWQISDNGTNQHTIVNGGPLIIQPGAYLVLGRNDNFATNGNVTVHYQYDNFTLGNGYDAVILKDNQGAEIDRIEYDNGLTFPDPNGASMELGDPNLDNAIGVNWQAALDTFGAGDRGTPGVRNSVSAPHLEINANSLVFGHICQGSNSVLELIISNTGFDTLVVDSIYTDNADFSPDIVEDNLARNDSITVTITFSPATVGAISGQFIIESNNNDQPQTIISLSGTGRYLNANIAVSADTLSFGEVFIGEGDSLSLTISNIGCNTLEVEEMDIDNPPFDIQPQQQTLPTDASFVATVTFSPQTAGVKIDTLTIHSDDDDQPQFHVILTGIGVVF
ncbi:MAG: choice-of-anchor D domain-containing protein, partial [Planctomycetes bacterium]|nr:choice-of-anchor D domain-containing protein [Planctomycetota bacterium]